MNSSYNKLYKTYKSFFYFSLAVFFLAGAFVPAKAKANYRNLFNIRKETSLRCDHLLSLQRLFLKNHIYFNQLTPDLEKRLVGQYVKKLDGGKSYFLQQDVDYIGKKMKSIFNDLKSGRCKTILNVYQLYLERVGQRVEFIKKNLQNPKYRIQRDLKFLVDFKLRSYPKTIKELKSFQAKHLQWQVASNIATGLNLKESKKKVLGFYERLLTRLQKKKKEDIYAIFLNSFADSLDPHSYYFSRSDFKDFEINMRLKFEGIGASLRDDNGFTVVESLIPGGAAEKSRLLKAEDKIVAVGQASGSMGNIVNMELKEVVQKIRGPKGSKVRLTILRKNEPRFTITLTRDEIKLADKKASIKYIRRKMNGKPKKIGIVELKSFYADMRGRKNSSAKDVKQLLIRAVQNKVDGLVLDLSKNGGGVLEDAVKIAGLFIKRGNIVKQSAMGNLKKGIILRDVDDKVYFSGPLVVLTSRASASASEIVAGALKDYLRAVIVGADHTFGKGTVQSVNNTPQLGGGAVKVTVSMFFIPGGNSTQHQGVISHILLPSIWNTDDYGEKSFDYSLKPHSIQSFASSLKSINFKKGSPSHWKVIRPNWVQELKKRSSLRVAKNEKFQKTLKEIKKSKKNQDYILISEVLKSGEKDKKKKKNKDIEKKKKTSFQNARKKTEEYLSREEVQEALAVLVDLMELQGGYPKTKTANTLSQ